MAALAYSAAELAEALGVSESTIYRRAAAGEIPALPLCRRWLFPKAAVDRWLERDGVAQTAVTSRASSLGGGERGDLATKEHAA